MAPEVLLEADFRVLGLEPGSKPSEVRQAYRALVKKWHPDRHHSKPYETRAFAEKKFREIDEAYRRISGSWEETQRSAGRPATSRRPGDRRSCGANVPSARVHAAPAARSRLENRYPALFQGKDPPACPAIGGSRFHFDATSFVFSRYTRSIRKLPARGPSNTRPGPKPQTAAEPSEATGPQSSADLTVPLLPFCPLPSSSLSRRRRALFSPWGRPPPKCSASRGPHPVSRARPGLTAFPRYSSETDVYGGSIISTGRCGCACSPGSPRIATSPAHITIGSSEEEVLLVQGTPTRVEGDKWFYGFAELVFKNGRVAEYDNYFGNLKVRILPSAPSGPEPPGNFFTIGSTPDEVLAVQGTPTAIHGNRWSFDFAAVIFRDGKVHERDQFRRDPSLCCAGKNRRRSRIVRQRLSQQAAKNSTSAAPGIKRPRENRKPQQNPQAT